MPWSWCVSEQSTTLKRSEEQTIPVHSVTWSHPRCNFLRAHRSVIVWRNIYIRHYMHSHCRFHNWYKTEHLSTLSSASQCDKVPLKVIRLFCKWDATARYCESLLEKTFSDTFLHPLLVVNFMNELIYGESKSRQWPAISQENLKNSDNV